MKFLTKEKVANNNNNSSHEFRIHNYVCITISMAACLGVLLLAKESFVNEQLCFSPPARASPADFHPMNRDQSNIVATQDLFLYYGNSKKINDFLV